MPCFYIYNLDMGETEIIFAVQESTETGFEAHALGHYIFTQAETMEELEAMIRDLRFSNELPVEHMWRVLEPRIESVRRDLASEFGCDTEEMAITRNASEANEIMIFGLDLKRGDRRGSGEDAKEPPRDEMHEEEKHRRI